MRDRRPPLAGFVAVAVAAMLAACTQPARAEGPRPERFVLLLDGGPLVIDVHLLLDGRPYAEAREALVDELLAQADTDGDGRPMWGEAILNPRFPVVARRLGQGGVVGVGGTGQQPSFDANGDEVVDRDEVRALLVQLGGRALDIVPDRSRPPVTRAAELIDANGDGRFADDELQAASSRLRAFDLNDDEVLDRAELQATSAYGQPIGNVQGGAAPGTDLVHLAGGSAAETLFERLLEDYGAKSPFLTRENVPLDPTLVDRLDANGDDRLDAAEAAGFTTIPAHLELNVNVGETSAGAVGVTVVRARPPFDESALLHATRKASLEVPLPTSAFALTTLPDRGSVDYSRTAAALLARVDGDSNAYIDRKEIEGQPQAAYYVQQFELWDVNEDGKVYADEIEAAYDRQLAPRRSQVVVTVGRRQAMLFDVLDVDGDGRLGLREATRIAERIAERDTNGDGVLQPGELPGQFSISFGRSGTNGTADGGFGRVVQVNGRGLPTGGPATNDAAGPMWFVHADVNRDGDLSPREFLGTPQQFRELDRNDDGLVDVDEANRAK